MHKVFGQKENETYFDREGAYIVPLRGDEIGVVETPKGFFFLGGGIDAGETDIECITRECLEEAGYQVVIEKKICSAETYSEHPTIGFFHPIQSYYLRYRVLLHWKYGTVIPNCQQDLTQIRFCFQITRHC